MSPPNSDPHTSGPIQFADPIYVPIDPNLRTGKELPTPPPEWERSTIRDRISEEPIETLLTLNLEALAGLPMAWVRWAWPMDPSVDIVTTDPLGRIHLLELKKKSFGRQEAHQLGQYLFKHVFEDPADYLADSREAGLRQTEWQSLAERIAAVFSNQRAGNTGWRLLVRTLGPDHPAAQRPGGGPLNSGQWARLGRTDKARRVHLAFERLAETLGVDTYPSWRAVKGRAQRLSRRLEHQCEASRTTGHPRRPAVIWLVGRSITSPALEQIRLWRRSGIDARPLILDARRSEHGWIIKVQREHFAARDALEAELVRRRGEWERVRRLTLYEETSPSIRYRHGGRPLAEPSAEVEKTDGTRSTICLTK